MKTTGKKEIIAETNHQQHRIRTREEKFAVHGRRLNTTLKKSVDN